MRLTNLTRAASVALALGLIVGCSSSRGRVTVRGEESRAVLAQSFNEAYIGAGRAGEYDIVLVQDPKPKPQQSGKKFWPVQWPGRSTASPRPLQPIGQDQVKQVVHIHVFWQAQGGSVARDGVVTNAAIDWYVFANADTDHAELIHYDGAGYVVLNEGRGGTTIEIRDGSMKKAESTGLADPLGPALLVGKVKAQRNTQLVRDTLADLKSRTTTPPTAVSESR
jgi:hypothetical protein